MNAFLETLPRDFLFVVRTSDLVRSLNKELGGTSRDRLVTLAESATRGLRIPNPKPQSEFNTDSSLWGTSLRWMFWERAAGNVGDGVQDEEAMFRKFLEREGISHPEGLPLTQPNARINRLVASEMGMSPSIIVWLDWLGLRVRIWTLDRVSSVLWWWTGQTSFTSRDIG
ncbi:unnamed protein product [Choristocarpus tenellus]